MKTIKIGKEDVELCESVQDIPIKRFLQFKEYQTFKQTGVSTPDLIEAMRGFMEGFDKDSKSQMLLSLHSYLLGLEAIEEGKDFDQLLFSVIAFEKGEDKTQFDETRAREKMERWGKHLKQGEVEEYVENFITASPKSSISFSQRSLERLKISKPPASLEESDLSEPN